ncbi:unnamed protein product [Caenorhabditis auriculariae]|uniref:Uncharacterized protein n=1 Tax=Caenorhabditis auriculariae TaxID=2777116 RepID=A0A8S1HLW5_9PELO|nr:unnamed protein product [Caenorhabditis auriculariae]
MDCCQSGNPGPTALISGRGDEAPPTASLFRGALLLDHTFFPDYIAWPVVEMSYKVPAQFLLLFFFQQIFADELISTRCQAQCLHNMEIRLQDSAEHRRSLKHHIIQLCKDDATCSACAAPCRETFDDVKACKKTCTTSDDAQTCEKSCDHLHSIYSEKPGSCPTFLNTSNYECTALCHLDGDCPETSKCCSYGCSRQCVRPKASDVKLLPIPRNITVQERKRKRSIIIRWATGRLSKDQANSNSNLFLVQWRWGLHTDDSAMTDWQTVTVRNKPYAILKHLLSPGRFYEFRIAAVSKDGSLGYSVHSTPFKISKEAKAPPPPKDISLGAARLTPVGLWNQLVQWHPPPSDLPIKNYQISWAVSSKAEADAFEEMMRRKAVLETPEKRSLDDDEEAWSIDGRDRHSVIVPSHSTHTEVSGLFPNSVYIVEVHASVDSTEGELHGEKGVVFVRTADSTVAVIESSTSKSEDDDDAGKESEELTVEAEKPTLDVSTISSNHVVEPSLEIQKPFFDGELQTNLNWLNSASCSPKKKRFVVRVRKTLCREYQPNHHSDTRWHDVQVDECVASLKGLSFDCDYKVEVSEAATGKPIVDGVFATETCEQTTSLSPIPCATLTSPITCHVSDRSARCHWPRHHDPMDTVIGYRILLASPISHDTNITINQPQLREVRYEDLRPGVVYTVEVQSITNRGLGRTVSTQFMTSDHLDHTFIERFPGGEIVELPLESSTSSRVLLLSFVIILLLSCVNVQP